MSIQSKEHLVDIGDTRLFVAERGNRYPLIVLHGGPGLITICLAITSTR
jgi:hypothetical protein